MLGCCGITQILIVREISARARERERERERGIKLGQLKELYSYGSGS